MIAPLENLVNEYLGVIVFKSNQKVTLKDNTWDIKHRNGLAGIIAFTKWSISISKAFHRCDRLTFILGLSPTLGTDMGWMFYDAKNFNQPLDFDTSCVTNMKGMFQRAKNFNKLLDFDTRNVTNMSYMFSEAINFNQPLDFDTRNVTNMSAMFQNAVSFNQPLSFDTGNVTYMRVMFNELIVSTSN